MSTYSKEKVSLCEQIECEAQHLPRGSELINDLQFSIYRLLNAGMDRDYIKILAIHASEEGILTKSQKNLTITANTN